MEPARTQQPAVSQSSQELWRADQLLAQEAHRGDRAAREEIARRVLAKALRTARRLAPRDREFDDLVSASVLEVLRSVGSFEGRCTLETWADRICVRTVVRWVSRRGSHAQVVAIRDEPEQATEVTGAEELERHRREARMESLLQKLPDEQRTALVLRLVHGYSVNEVAEMVGAPVNTVRERLRVARVRMRQWILRDPILVDPVEERVP